MEAVNKIGESVLMAASSGRNIKLVKYLCEEKNADVFARDKYGGGVLSRCCLWHDNLELTRYFVENWRLDVNATSKEGHSCLMNAARNNLEAVKYLISKGADPYARNKKGWNALFYACRTHKEDIVLYLIKKHKMDLNEKDKTGRSAEQAAFYFRGVCPKEFCKFLSDLKSGAVSP